MKSPSLEIVSDSPIDFEVEWLQLRHHFKQHSVRWGDLFYCLGSARRYIMWGKIQKIQGGYRRYSDTSCGGGMSSMEPRIVWPSHRDLIDTCHSSESA